MKLCFLKLRYGRAPCGYFPDGSRPCLPVYNLRQAHPRSAAGLSLIAAGSFLSGWRPSQGPNLLVGVVKASAPVSLPFSNIPSHF
jgi:hypothetical protein